MDKETKAEYNRRYREKKKLEKEKEKGIINNIIVNPPEVSSAKAVPLPSDEEKEDVKYDIEITGDESIDIETAQMDAKDKVRNIYDDIRRKEEAPYI
jgi:hypothetical protein